MLVTWHGDGAGVGRSLSAGAVVVFIKLLLQLLPA